MSLTVEIQMNHYAFLVDDDLFDRAYQRPRDRGIEHWADPQGAGRARPTPGTAAGASTSRTPPATGSS
ncbi:MAG TPA: hypothetical protein VFO01_12310 [Trebonia sp.]|nr:hypothetical protein [Trebonia sp.]